MPPPGRAIGSPLRHRLGCQPGGLLARRPAAGDGRADGTARIWEVDRPGRGGRWPAGWAPGRGRRRPRRPPDPGPRSTVPASARGGPGVLLRGETGRPSLVDLRGPASRPARRCGSAGRGSATLAFSPDGRLLAIASTTGISRAEAAGPRVELWDAAAGRPASPLLPHINWVAAMAFRPDGAVLATGDYSGDRASLGRAYRGRGSPARSSRAASCCSWPSAPTDRVLAAGTAETGASAGPWDAAGTADRRADPVPEDRPIPGLQRRRPSAGRRLGRRHGAAHRGGHRPARRRPAPGRRPSAGWPSAPTAARC